MSRITLIICALATAIVTSCSTRNRTRSEMLSLENEQRPSKPNDLPKSSIIFTTQNLKFLTGSNHGGEYCVEISKLVTATAARSDLSSISLSLLAKLTHYGHHFCGQEGSFLGFTAKDGMSSDNELFISNKILISHGLELAFNLAKALNSNADMAFFSSEISIFKEDISTFITSAAKFDRELDQNPNYASFTNWVKSLIEWYESKAS